MLVGVMLGMLIKIITTKMTDVSDKVRMRTAPSGQQVYSKRGVLLRYVPQVIVDCPTR